MQRSLTVIALACVLAFVGAPSAQQPDALQAAAAALGVADLKALEFTAAGAIFPLGQNFAPDDPWPRVALKSYAALIDYDASGMRVDLVMENGEVWPLGGSSGGPFIGQRRQIQVVSGADAWNVPLAPPGGGAAPPAQPQPAAALERRLALWATPHGFVKAALANRAETRAVRDGTEVSFTIDGKYKMTGLINPAHHVERVETWIDHPLAGDVPMQTVYSVYRDYDGVLFPSRLVQTQDGFPTLDLRFMTVRRNPAAAITVPENVRGAQPPPVVVNSQALAAGVYFLTGGGHHSLAVEMQDHIVLVDTPNNEPRALGVIAKAKELIPNKPIRYVINSHHHWDHSGGLRTAMDEGATIVTHEINRAFFERVAKRPHTLVPDRLSKSKKTPKFLTVGAEGVRLTDGIRTVAVYEITPNEHARDLVLVYLPKEKILAEPDAYNAQAQRGRLLDAVEVQKAAALYDTIRRRQLDVQTIAPFHGGRTTDVAELAMSLGKR